jgi:hypothetical protein
MRANQMMPAIQFQDFCQPNWLAHTPVGHDSFVVTSIAHIS